MADQPPPLKEMEEISKTNLLRYSTSPQEDTEMLRKNSQTRSQFTLARKSNVVNLGNTTHREVSQGLAPMSSQSHVEFYQAQYDAIMQASINEAPTSNTMKFNQKGLDVNNCIITSSQSSKKPPKEEMIDLPQPIICFSHCAIPSYPENAQEKEAREFPKALSTLNQGEISQGYANFNKSCVANLPNRTGLDNEAHADMDQNSSNSPSLTSANFYSHGEIHPDIQKYHSVISADSYNPIELSKEAFDSNTSSLSQSEWQIPQHEQERLDMRWLERAWLRATAALYAGTVWKGMETEQKAAFDRAITYRAHHRELDSSSFRSQIDKYTGRILHVIDKLRAGGNLPITVKLQSILMEAASVNTLSHERCNELVGDNRSSDNLDLFDLLDSETFRKASEDARSIHGSQSNISNHREQAVACMHITGPIIQQPRKQRSSDVKSGGLKELATKQANNFFGEDCSSDLHSGEPMQINNSKSEVAVNLDDTTNVRDSRVTSQVFFTNTKSIHASQQPDEGKQFAAENFPVKELSPLEMAIRNPLPCWNHPMALNGQVYYRIRVPILFTYFKFYGISDESLLSQITKSLEHLSVPMPFPVPAGAPKWLHDYRILNGQVCKPYTSVPTRELLPLLPFKTDSRTVYKSKCGVIPKTQSPLVPINTYKSLDSDWKSTAPSPQEMKHGPPSFEKEQIPSMYLPPTLASVQYPGETRVAYAFSSTGGQHMMNEDRQMFMLSEKLFHGRHKLEEERKANDPSFHTYGESLSGAIKASHAQIKTKASLTQDSRTNPANYDSSLHNISQEKLNALKIMDQDRREQRSLPIRVKAKNINVNGGDIASKRAWHLEYYDFLEDLRKMEDYSEPKRSVEACQKEGLEIRHPDATYDDPRQLGESKHSIYQKLTMFKEAKEKSRASTAATYWPNPAVTQDEIAAYLGDQKRTTDSKAFQAQNTYQFNDTEFEERISGSPSCSFELPMHGQKQQKTSVSSNDYITAEDHAQGHRDDYDRSAIQDCLSHPNEVHAHHDLRTLNTSVSSKPPVVAGQYTNPGSLKDCSVKSIDCPRDMNLLEEQNTKPSKAGIMRALKLAREARRLKSAGKEQRISYCNYKRTIPPANMIGFAALKSCVLDPVAAREKGQHTSEVADKNTAVLNNANDILTKPSKATDTPGTTINEHTVMANNIVTDDSDTYKKLTNNDAASVKDLAAIAGNTFIQTTETSDVSTTQCAVNNEGNPSSETIPDTEITNIEDDTPNEPSASAFARTEAIGLDIMQDSPLFYSPPTNTSTSTVTSRFAEEVVFEDDSDVQSEGSWVMADDYDDVEEAGELNQVHSVEGSEDVEGWEML